MNEEKRDAIERSLKSLHTLCADQTQMGVTQWYQLRSLAMQDEILLQLVRTRGFSEAEVQAELDRAYLRVEAGCRKLIREKLSLTQDMRKALAPGGNSPLKAQAPPASDSDGTEA